MKNQSRVNPETRCIQSIGRALRTGKSKNFALELIGLDKMNLEDISIPDKKTLSDNQDNDEKG